MKDPQFNFQSVKILYDIFLLGIKKEEGSTQYKKKQNREKILCFKGHKVPRCSFDEVLVL